MRSSATIISAAAVVLTCATITAPSAQTIKFGTFIPPTSATYQGAAKPWMEAVEKETDGAITFQRFLGGSLGRSPAQQFELLVNGVQDATIVLPSYTQKLFPEFSILSLPYLFDSAEEASVAGWRLHEAGMLSGLDKVQVISVWANGNSAIHLRRDVRASEDLKGLKIRTAGPEEAAVIEALGAVPVGMGINQVAESLNRGVLDGALASWSALRAFRIFPLIRSHYEEPLGVRSFFLAVRKEVYDSLSPDKRNVLMKHGGEALALSMGRVNDREVEELQDEARASDGHRIVRISDGQVPERERLFQRFHDEWVENQENGRQVYETLKRIIADLRAKS